MWSFFGSSVEYVTKKLTPQQPQLEKNTQEDLNHLINLSLENSEEANRSLQIRLQAFFQNYLPYDISAYSRENFIGILLKSGAWPPNPNIEFPDIGKLKTELIAVIKSIMDNNNLKINALMQSLCKNTLLGHIFHFSWHMYGVPSISSGTLKEAAIALNEILISVKGQKFELLEDTLQALREEFDRNKDFDQSLRAYPYIHDTISPFVAEEKVRSFHK